MTALHVMRKALPLIGTGRENIRGGNYGTADLYDALSIAGEGQPKSVLVSFWFLRVAVGEDNLLAWNKRASYQQMKCALEAAITLARVQ
jgi:hypothetical protein